MQIINKSQSKQQKQNISESSSTAPSPQNNKTVEEEQDESIFAHKLRQLKRLNKPRGMWRRLLHKFHLKRHDLSSELKLSSSTWDDEMEYAERQNKVSTFELFKYAKFNEKVAVVCGVLFMWYAASWQPISVFILAIMASLMGQYSKQVSWLQQLTSNSSASNTMTPSQINSTLFPLAPPAQLQVPQTGSPSQYKEYSFLAPLYSIVTPFYELSNTATNKSNHIEELKESVKEILDHESNLFLRKSFEINGSAFVLALTQLAAFLIGMSLITWAARKQASRIKILYFRSCLLQEVTWFESIDSASGSGSSLNALVEKYEDGIGMKLALLSYFLGHVALFFISAFYQMANLAAFCMPFVLVVGLFIAYLSEYQANAVGQHALFAKRSLQLAEEIIASIRTVFAFNGQQKEITRYSISLHPVYGKSLIKHLYTALNTSLSKFSIFACFSAYCFYAMRLFPPYSSDPLNKSTVLGVMRGAEVSIVNILISIPFMEALQQSRGSIARIYAAIQRRSKIDPSSSRGSKPTKWQPSISFRMVQFGYAERGGPSARRRSTLPFLNLAGSPGSGVQQAMEQAAAVPGGVANAEKRDRRRSLIEEIAHEIETTTGEHPAAAASNRKSAVKKIMGAEIDKRSKKRILTSFNLNIQAGQSVALVGPSGSGKSTVLSLVQRLYDITGGQLLIGEHDIKDLNVSWLRNQIGLVTQEPRLFDMSISDNIRLGLESFELENMDERLVNKQIVEASQAAGAHEFITRLPNGYATRVGSGGVQLSGGQKQRIAIARALIRRPKILLLDESTSALDTESEAKVTAALRAASLGRTTITVAHRLETIKHVDLIVVMSQGRVIECGTHEELMSPPDDSISAYKVMYETQRASITDSKPILPPVVDDLKKDSIDRMFDFGNTTTTIPESTGKVSFYDEEMDNYDDPGIADDASSSSSGSSRADKPGAWQLWHFVETPKWSSLIAALVCLIAGLILPMNLIAHSYLFSAFAYGEPDEIGEYLHVFGLLMLALSTFVFIVSLLQVLMPGYVGEKLSNRLRVKTMDAFLNKPMFYFDMDSNSAGALCDRFNSCISNLQSISGTRIATMLEAISTLAAGAIFGFGQNLRLSMFCLAFAIIVLITTIIESRILQRECELQQKFDAKLAHLMADALSNMKTIASLNREQYFIRKFSSIVDQRESSMKMHILIFRTFLTSLKFVMPALSWSASMYYGCHLLVEGSIDLQTIFVVCPVVLFAVNDTFRALVFLPELLKARKSIDRLYRMNMEFSPQVLQTMTLAQQFEQQNRLYEEQANGIQEQEDSSARKSISFLEASPNQLCPDNLQVNRRMSNIGALPTYMRRKSSRLNSLVPRAQANGKIEFKDVEFAYPNRPTALVLDGFSLQIIPGENVALVGSSGSGKSTCVSILEKFYDYHAGRVTLDGHDLRLVEPNWIRSQIGLVSQEPVLLSYTIGDNIRYGDNSRFVSMEEVVEAARTANIHDFIMSLPDQYDTQLSTSTHSGSQLSGGQRQRVAIARALIRNSPILIFDEATSALDSRNETVVQDALNKARRGRTSLTIAHRLASIRDSDKIVVMKDGRVVEIGKHDELMTIDDGHYKLLWQKQESTAKSRHPNADDEP